MKDSIRENIRVFQHDEIETVSLSNARILGLHTLMLFHKSANPPNIDYKVLSTLSKYTDKFIFTTNEDPEKNMIDAFTLDKLPMIGGILAPVVGTSPTDSLKQFTYRGKVAFYELE